MSTYWNQVNKKYPVTFVLEDLSTGVQSTHKVELTYLYGFAYIVPREGSVIFQEEGAPIYSGSSISAAIPEGVKVVSVDTSSIPKGIATLETKDGAIGNPACGVMVKGKISNGHGIDPNVYETQSAPS
tara:strand:+ start:110 stop:493 length:384 start_codon:yes stop_codon:yes gene_type:complete